MKVKGLKGKWDPLVLSGHISLYLGGGAPVSPTKGEKKLYFGRFLAKIFFSGFGGFELFPLPGNLVKRQRGFGPLFGKGKELFFLNFSAPIGP